MKKSQSHLDNKFMKMALDKAYEHLGSTKENPSVGCIVVKNNAVISSGTTSLNGRPHAEFNALNKKINFKDSKLYVTLEPCVHYGLTSPCINIIKKKGIKKVYYSILDSDKRTKSKAKSQLKKSNIKVNIGLMKNESLDFYKSYILSKDKKSLPYMDVKIAISKDFFTVNKKNKWITNEYSRNNGHLLRSKYDCILTTYRSVNNDNSLLNCRIDGMQHLSPSRVIIDKNLKLKHNLKLLRTGKKIPTFVITDTENKSKERLFKSKNITLIKVPNEEKKLSYKKILMELKKRGYSRILCEAGSYTAGELLKKRLVNNLYVYMSQTNLRKNGKKSFKKHIKDLSISNKNKVNVNLFGDVLYKVRIK